MRRSFSHIIFLLLAGIILTNVACTSDKPSDREDKTPLVIRNKTSLTVPKGLRKLKLGDSLQFEVSAREGVNIDSVKVTYQNETIYTSTASRFSISSSFISHTGKPKIVLKVYFDSAKTESLYPKYLLLPDAPAKLGYNVKNEYPHKRTSYTQGLFFKDGVLYESTGQNGTSRVMKVDKNTGETLKATDLDNSLFGEGITYIGDSIFHLTYRAGQAFVYDTDFNKLHTFNYSGEGWGIEAYGDTLLTTDGSENITFRNKNDFTVFKKLSIHDDKGPLRKLNELEMIDGYLYANVYQKDYIVKIDLNNGAVVGRLDLSGIFPERNSYGSQVDVLNGIAYLPETNRVYVTGKLWPKLYEIELVQ